MMTKEKRKNNTILIGLMVFVLSVSLVSAKANALDLIRVSNSSNKKIAKIVASSDGENYGLFSSGNGIKPGETVEYGWDTQGKTTCVVYLKAVYADRSESKPAQVDPCRGNVAVDFE